MLRVGLTGGIASGKSEVARRLAALGAVLIDADVLAREVVRPGTVGLERVVQAFGREILTADGALDRAKLGALVFADPDKRRELEAIVHPLVRARAAELEAGALPDAIVVQDIPLLAETGQADRFDVVVVVDVPREVQVVRLITERGLSREEAVRRIDAQATREQRRAIADELVDNAGTLDDLDRRVAELWHSLTTRAA